MKIQIDGLYYSKKTRKIFEATLKRNKVIIKYVDGTTGMILNRNIFLIQAIWLNFYDQLADYGTGEYKL